MQVDEASQAKTRSATEPIVLVHRALEAQVCEVQANGSAIHIPNANSVSVLAGA